MNYIVCRTAEIADIWGPIICEYDGVDFITVVDEDYFDENGLGEEVGCIVVGEEDLNV